MLWMKCINNIPHFALSYPRKIKWEVGEWYQYGMDKTLDDW